MNQFKPTALASTFAIIDLILHPLFRLWVWLDPQSYLYTMHLLVEGLELKIDPTIDLSFWPFITGTLLEALVFWCLGYMVAFIYNKLSHSK